MEPSLEGMKNGQHSKGGFLQGFAIISLEHTEKQKETLFPFLWVISTGWEPRKQPRTGDKVFHTRRHSQSLSNAV